MGGLAQPGTARENRRLSVAPRGKTQLFKKLYFCRARESSPAFGDRPLPPLGTMAPCPTVRDRGNLSSNTCLPLLVSRLANFQPDTERSLLS